MGQKRPVPPSDRGLAAAIGVCRNPTDLQHGGFPRAFLFELEIPARNKVPSSQMLTLRSLTPCELQCSLWKVCSIQGSP
jgi:hypothetical protein